MTETAPGATPNRDQEERDYSATLFLPQTEFPMRAGLPQREPEWLARWEEMGLYDKLRAMSQDRPKFTLHDGPPYANGAIHIGHALNKTMKDFVARSMQMLGYNSAYVPGWDCHGLPIEWKIEEQYRAKGQNKDEVPINEFRAECRAFADHWLDTQREEFKRLGVVGDWDNPYLTMSFEAEAQIARELMKVARKGQLYRGSKPVMWSVVERTALAEAEIEYQEYESDAIWVKFPVARVDGDFRGEWAGAGDQVPTEGPESLEGAFVVIWTTTPWTIPANRAVSFSSEIAYGLYTIEEAENDFGPQPGERVIFADKLADASLKKAKLIARRVGNVTAEQFSAMTLHHPLRGLEEGFTYDVPLLDGEHVTDEAGTGFVHTAPGHGMDDFEIWMDNQRVLADRGIDTSVPFLVGADGYYTREVPAFGPQMEGGAARIIDDKGKPGDANKRVIAGLIAQDRLFARGRLKHQYPHSWRSKKPIIFRNTPQWFVYMDKDIAGAGDTLRARALKAIDETQFVPPQRKNRLRSMIADRPDWVLSRQRAWGVPITIFVHRETGEILHDDAVDKRIADAFEAEGADAWFAEGAKARFLDNAVDDADAWDPVTDILDVWFDSGSTHSYVLENEKRWPDLKWPASMYLEGTDQHRGWFHSSLLESCVTRGRAPYDAVLTTGFTMDQKGMKMSKSLGNVIAPQDIIKKYGADILRLWAATIDYAEDHRLGEDIIKNTVETYRKIRNSFRWLLGNLAHYKASEAIEAADMPELERLILHRIAVLDGEVRAAYEAYDYKKVVALIGNFMNLELSAFYFDIRKDALYCDPISSLRRKSALTVLHHLYECLTVWLAPVLAFTMEEVWLERHVGADTTVHAETFPQIPATWRDDALAEKWARIRAVRRVVTGALEIERKNKTIGASLEAAPQVFITDDALLAAIEGHDFADICITSSITLERVDALPGDAFTLEDVAGVAVRFDRAEGTRCARSWKITQQVGTETDYPDLTPRDAQAMREREAAGLPV